MTMLEWKKPEIVVVDLREYEKAILANANSGGSGGGGGGCACWSVGCSSSWR